MDLADLPISGNAARLPLDFLEIRGVTAPELVDPLKVFVENGVMTHAQWWSALTQIQTHLSEPDVMFQIGQRLEVRHLGVLGYLLLTSNNIGEALLRLQRFIPLLHKSDSISIGIDGFNLVLTWSRNSGVSNVASDEIYFSAMQRFLQLALEDPNIHFSRLELCYPEPAHAGLYESVFGCPVVFNCSFHRIFLPLTVLRSPLRQADPTLNKILETQAQSLLATIPDQGEFLDQLRKMILFCIQDGETSAVHIAKKLGMSRRTLHRRLVDYQLDFTTVLKNTRIELAKRYLQDGRLELTEVALLLGYADQSTFTRAFREWFGTAPSAYRKSVSCASKP